MGRLSPPGPPRPLTPQAVAGDGGALIHTSLGHFRLLPGESLTFACGADGRVTTRHQKAAEAGPRAPGGGRRAAALAVVLEGLRAPKAGE